MKQQSGQAWCIGALEKRSGARGHLKAWASIMSVQEYLATQADILSFALPTSTGTEHECTSMMSSSK